MTDRQSLLEAGRKKFRRNITPDDQDANLFLHQRGRRSVAELCMFADDNVAEEEIMDRLVKRS